LKLPVRSLRILSIAGPVRRDPALLIPFPYRCIATPVSIGSPQLGIPVPTERVTSARAGAVGRVADSTRSAAESADRNRQRAIVTRCPVVHMTALR